MNWRIVLIGEDERPLGEMYCVSRAEARERARWYRTMTEGPGRVVRTRVEAT